MPPVTATSSARLLAFVVACIALTLVAVVWFRSNGGGGAHVVGDSSSQDGWKTIEYQGVRVDIPSDWGRLDPSECEFQIERWAQPDSPPCDFEQGAAFYASATFDPADGPGVRRTTENGSATWAGYVDSGDFVVYASDADRGVVQELLDSVRVTEE
jgi:hypothetical protein